VDFSAQLHLNRDHAFGAWDQFNVAALAHLLGAAVTDIRGVNGRGNSSGDLISAAGRATYARNTTGDGWTLSHVGPADQVDDPKRLRLRDQAWDVAQLVVTAPQMWRIVRANLAWAIGRSRGQLARMRGGYALAGGSIGSDGWSIVEALRENDQERRPVVNLATRDESELLSMLRDVAATAAILDSDRVATAEIANLRAVAALYPKPVHILVAPDSPVASIADLRGKRIAISNGPSRAADDILRAHRLPAGTVNSLIDLPLGEALTALGEGKLDAVVVAARAPADPIADAMGQKPFRLLGLDSDAIALLTTGETRYPSIKIPGRTYPGQPNSVTTLGVIATLIAPLSVPETEIAALLKSLMGPVDYLHAGSVAGSLISPTTAQFGLNLPLHPGAESYFRSLTIAR
jgi:TRAP transporter TAXI family solute receptor